MIIDKYISITLNSKNISHYKNLGYHMPIKPNGCKLTIPVEQLSNGSHCEVSAKCDYCEVIKKVKYYEYRRNILHNDKFSCSNRCGALKKKEISIITHGVESPSTLEEIKMKSRKTCFEKYGSDFFMSTNEFKIKSRNSMIVKYGVENAMFSDKIKERLRNNNLVKYGCYNIYKDKNYIRYIGYQTSLFNCDKGHEFEIHTDNYHSRIKIGVSLCTICSPIGDQKSIKENDLSKIYTGKISQSYRDGLEIDIYLPELNIGFEFNGLYYHSDKFKNRNYHIDKTNYFKERGIRIINIWEDDWVFRRDIIESQVRNLLQVNVNKIFARKCRIKVVDVKDIRKFLDKNHIQGMVNSSLKLGLYYNEELVSLMTFDHFEGRKKMEEGSWNLNRFCNKLNTNVIGSASKLLIYFTKNYNVKRIVSYADKDWSVGDLYYTLGFENIGCSGPDYKYIVDNQRIHKSRYKKSNLKTTLSESAEMKNKNILRIYDCGKIKFEKKIY